MKRKLVLSGTRATASVWWAALAVLAVGAAPVCAATLTWDANADTAGQTDGAGLWDTVASNVWWTGSANTTWTPGSDARFGNGGAGGAVTQSSAFAVNSLALDAFSGTYALGLAGQTITLQAGITVNSIMGGTATLVSTSVLGAAQAWVNNKYDADAKAGAGSLVAGTSTDGIDNGGHTLTFDGIGTTQFKGVLAGNGGIIKNGPGVLVLGANPAPAHTYSGTTTINGGVVRVSGTLPANSGLTINNGVLEDYWTGTLARNLGSSSGEVQILGGTSGFSGQGSGATFRMGSAGSTLQWGSTYFNPDVLVLQAPTVNVNGKMTLQNAIDLNGYTRTIASLGGDNTGGATVQYAITNGTGAGVGLIKAGPGNLILQGSNTYDGATTIAGWLTLSGASGVLPLTSDISLNAGALQMINTTAQTGVNRVANSAPITSTGGGIAWGNSSGNSIVYAETLGSVTNASGQLDIVESTAQVGTGTSAQTLTLSGLTRGGSSAVAFSAAGTGPQASGNKNMIVVSGAGTTPANQIIGPWATIGTAANAQTDYAVYNSDYVVGLGATPSTDDSGWSTTWADTSNYAWGNTTVGMTFSATRNINTLRHTGGAETLTVATDANLGTYGILNGVASVLTIAASGSGVVTLPTNSAGELHINPGSAGITISAPIADNVGALTLVKNGAGGNLILSGSSTYTGDTIINAGILQLGINNTANGAKLGSGGTYAGNIFIGGGLTSATLHIQTDAAQTLSGVISGGGSLVKSYNGTLTLAGSNTYTGKTWIRPLTTAGAGTLVVSSFNSVTTDVSLGTVHSASSSLGAPTTVANGTVDFGSGSVQSGGTLKYTGPGEITDRVINFILNGNGAGKTLEASGGSLLKFVSKFTGSGSVNNDITLTGTGDGEIVGGLDFMFRNFTKSAAGAWTLGGTVGNYGTATISGGKLRINGTLGVGNNAVSVTGGSLGGTGTIRGSVTVAAAGSLEPGASAGTLSIGGNLTNSAQAAGAGKLYFELGALAGPNDRIAVGGTLSIGSGVLGFSDLVFTNLGGMQNGTYKLITSGGINGTLNGADLSGAIGALTGTLQIASNDLELVVTGGGGCVTPTAFNVTGGGAYCAGDAGVAVGLDGSESGVDYQLYRNGGATAVGSPVAGTGSAISLGTQTVADTYTVVGTRVAGGCTNNMSGSATVTVSTPATADAGPDQSVNHNTNVTLAGAIGGSASSASWSGGGGSYAPDANTLSAVYTPSAAEKLAGTVTLTLTTDDPGGPCGAAADAVTITLTNTPPVASNFTMGVQQGSTTSVIIIAGKHAPSDADGDPLTVTAADLVTPANGGSVSVIGGTAITYVASGSFSGTDTFTYVVSDGFGGSSTATVDVIVSPAAGGLNITGIAVVTGVTVKVTAQGVPSATYRLQYTDSLSPVSWQDVAGSDQVAGTNGTMTLLHTDNGAVPPARYYSTRHVSGP